MVIDSIMLRMLARLGQTRAFCSVAMPEVVKDYADVLIVTTDLVHASGLEGIMRKNPEKIINVGIAEQNMVSIASGLAVENFCVFAIGYASFIATRSIDQIRLNILAMETNVKLVGIWSGVALELGVSHYATEDIAIMRSMPGMIILSPADGLEAYKMALAAASVRRPVYIRLSGLMESPSVYKDDYDFSIGQAVKIAEGDDVAILATGAMVYESIRAEAILKDKGISCAVYNFHTINPLDTEALNEIFAKYKLIVTAEEHSARGGLGGAVAEYKTSFTNMPRQIILGLPDGLLKAGSQKYIWDLAGITGERIATRILGEMAGVK